MQRRTALVPSVVLRFFLCSSLLAPLTAQAQGLAGSEVSGTVRSANGRAVSDVMIILRNRSTGAERKTRTVENGGYRFEDVDVGTYRLDARAIGIKAASIDSLDVHLGDRVRIDVTLGATATILDDAVIVATHQRDPGAGGFAETIAGRAARNIPLANRDFLGLLTLSSQSLGRDGLWITGQHSRYNGIQIDGAAANDFFGTGVAPGSASGSRLISPEAIEEVRILVAPFDVRLGGFAGGLINAVTRSGSNQRHYSAFASLARADLVGKDTSGAAFPEFNQIQYGLTASGPLILDRAHYFFAAEFQQRNAPFIGLSVNDSASGITEETALRIQNSIRRQFGFDPGGAGTPVLYTPTGNAFLKLSWHPRPNLSVDLTPSYARSRRDTTARATGVGGDGWQLDRSGAQIFSDSYGAVLKSNLVSGSATNETIVGFSANRFGIKSNIRAPLFLVQADAANVYASAGSMRGAEGTTTFASVAQLANNLSWTRGNHTLVAGTQDFLVHVRDDFLSTAWGAWTFGSVDMLEQGRPSLYEIALPARPNDPTAEYRTLFASAYAQDQWQLNSSLRLTFGLRGDAPFLEAPVRNETLLANDTLGNIDTRNVPSGRWQLSPRAGFAWSPGARGQTMLRGGIGLFAARLPVVWSNGAYASTGETQAFLTCSESQGIPAVTANIHEMPRSCSGSDGPSSIVSLVSVFDSDFRIPQAMKAVIGVDRDLGSQWTASVDAIAARTQNQLTVTDVNLIRTTTSGEGRAMYATISPSGGLQPARKTKQYGAVYRFENYTADRFTSVSVNLRKDWSADKLIHIGYTWSRTQDVMSLAGFTAPVMFRNNPVDGSIESRAFRRSARDIPHNFVATTVFPVGAGVIGAFFLRARSGSPWAFTINGDANGDGGRSNDLAYIPRDSLDISLTNPAAYRALDDLIQSLPCANSQRGHIMHRNSCRNSAVALLDGKVAKRFAMKKSQNTEISVDLFNIPNMLNNRWGIIRETTVREDVQLLLPSGWDSTHNRNRYTVPATKSGLPILPSIDKAVIDASRWRLQLGARYEF